MNQGRVRPQSRFLQLAELCGYQNLVHGFSTRRGGVSEPPFSSLNLSLNVGDDSASVSENRRLFLSDLGIGDNPLLQAKQVHGDDSARMFCDGCLDQVGIEIKCARIDIDKDWPRSHE